jgi:thimet oligopeptidase
MKYLSSLFVLLILFACQPEPIELVVVEVPDNPLFNTFNEPIDFASLTADDILEASTAVQEITNAALTNLINVREGDRNWENTMVALDDLYAGFDMTASAIYLMSYTHPDSALRSNALTENTALSVYINEVALNEDLYKAIKSYSESKEAKALTGYQAKFLKESVADFERNGFALSAEKREELKVINNELSAIGDDFSKNIASFQDFLILSEDEMDGLPEDFKEARKQEDGTYKVDLSYPSYGPFMRYAKSEEARKELYMKYMNRAYPDNLDVLQNLLRKRLEMANLLGYETYSNYRLEDRMAKNPQTVWDFETSLAEDVRPKQLLDMEELVNYKNELSGNSDPMKAWESSFYRDKMLINNYQVDAEEVKQYFALDDVIEGLFTITQTIFDLKYKEVENPSVWQEDVRMFEVYQDEKLKGIFYLDLHPRPNKYGHAACFGVKNGKMTADGYQIPMASLVCNFPEPTANKPALMPHGQVETFFHEFGHVLHHMVTTADLYSQSGTNVARDFVEAPSQIFENWAWDYDAVKLFAKHYDTREVMPEELFNKMLAAKNVGSGSGAAGQIFYGTYDLTLHDKYDPNGEVSTTDILRDLQNKISTMPYTEGTHFQCAFGHLNGYGSSYYGYMWSLVYAQDMFSIFAENGILDKTTGLRYRDIILAKGSSEDPLDLVKDFLGRDPNNEAFLKDLGL